MTLNTNELHFIFICCFLLISLSTAFKAYWNVPTQQCKNKLMNFAPLVEQYGILANNEDKFQGDKITIFYENQLGLYPRILKNGTMINGGIPQFGNLEEHLRKAAEDIDNVIPDNNFNGLGVIDWESWRPIWGLNFASFRAYRIAQENYTQKTHPGLSKKEFEKLVEFQWEENAKSWMLKTIQLAKQMRPKARWCYYLFPDCYNNKGMSPRDFDCEEKIINANDKLSWLWQESTAICPSIYLKEKALNKYTFEQRMWQDQGRLKEAIRVATPGAKIYPYVTYYLNPKNYTMVPEEELWRSLAQIAALGEDGVVIWGSSASVGSKAHCQLLKEYITNVLGPAIEKITLNYLRCAHDICSNRGSCTWPSDEMVNAWKLFIAEMDQNFDTSDITCRCEVGYTGRYCENEI